MTELKEEQILIDLVRFTATMCENIPTDKSYREYVSGHEGEVLGAFILFRAGRPTTSEIAAAWEIGSFISENQK